MRFVVFVLACSLSAADLASTVAGILSGSEEARQSFWGIRVTDASTGELVFAQDDQKFFVPASNTKLFTTSLALTKLGPNYRFRTRVEVPVRPDSAGRVTEVRLIGGGDPTLSARLIPYVKDKIGTNPLVHVEAMADQIVAAGVREVAGDVVGDDSAWEWEPYPDGWSADDPIWEYGAPVSALTLNDNAFRLDIHPGALAGSPAALSVWPAIEYLTIHNRTRTVAKGPTKVSIDRLPGSRELIVSGDVLAGARRDPEYLAIDDPAAYAATALREALQKRGVRVTGDVRAVHRRAGEQPLSWKGVEIAAHESAPLSDILQVINKVSQNLHTEMLLRELARRKTGVGSRTEGLKEIAAWLTELGVERKQYNFADASGLSRLTLVTPATVGRVLLHMHRSPHRDVWLRSLPVGGQDGTLAKRFAGNPQGARIVAKTGSISHVSTLSGYALRSDGRTLAFSIMANNYNAPHAEIRKVIDRIALALLE